MWPKIRWRNNHFWFLVILYEMKWTFTKVWPIDLNILKMQNLAKMPKSPEKFVKLTLSQFCTRRLLNMCCYQIWEKLPSGNAFLNKSINCAIVSLPLGQSILNLLNQSIIWSSVKLVFSMQKSMSSDFKYDPVYLVNKIQL